MTVFRFVEQPDSNEKNVDQKTKVKFKIMSLKVKAETDYAPELVNIPHFSAHHGMLRPCIHFQGI